MLIAFLFAPVAARAIAIVGTNPVSGMTMLTLIVTGFVLLKMGLSGGNGMFVTMMVGGVVCTALAASGALASDLKVGHWIGATPSTPARPQVRRHRGRGHLLRHHDVGDVAGRPRAGLRHRRHPGAAGLGHEGDPGRHLRRDSRPAAVVPLRSRRVARAHSADDRRSAARLRPRHVPAHGAQHAGAARRHPVVARRPQRSRTTATPTSRREPTAGSCWPPV